MSLRRMGRRESARKVALLGLALTAAEAAILFFIPDVFSRLVGFAAEIAFRLIFPPLMQKEFTEWEGNHAGVRPANGWKAVGWGLIGVVLFFVILLSVFTGLLAVLPGR
ncbi:MAG TPA: hypothetical protein VFQ00_03190 [Terriglobales bacterium]|nr:hypothetical protein [Terriglobales bacterium]